MLRHHWLDAASGVALSVGLSLSACGDGSSHGGFAAREQDAATDTLTDASVPMDGWTVFDPGCGYTLVAPPDVAQIPTRGTDSCVSEFASPPCSFEGDFGMYSGPETQDDSQANYRERTVRIGDRSGVQLVTYETTSSPTVFVARTFFPAVKSAGPTLSLLAQCQNADGRELALTVLQTVQFQ